MFKRSKSPDGFQRRVFKGKVRKGVTVCMTRSWTFFRLIDGEVIRWYFWSHDHQPSGFNRSVVFKGFPGGTSAKEPTCQCRRCKRWGFDPWVRKSPWWRIWQPTPLFLPGKSHQQRSLAGYNPWGGKESDTTEHPHTYTHIHSFIRKKTHCQIIHQESLVSKEYRSRIQGKVRVTCSN